VELYWAYTGPKIELRSHGVVEIRSPYYHCKESIQHTIKNWGEKLPEKIPAALINLILAIKKFQLFVC